MITRRRFIRDSSLLAGAMCTAGLGGCERRGELKGTLGGPDSARGHRVYGSTPGPPSVVEKEDIVIVGGGVAGLSAARWLKRQGQSFVLLELEDEPGGNARAAKNATASYPLGAHYLPLPSMRQPDLVSFLEECGVITGYENGLPVFNEYHLCFDPKERLFIHHHWQEGLIPHEGVPHKDRDEIQKFLGLMEEYRTLTGNDGRIAFDIPIHESSHDPSLLRLDGISMRAYLKEQGFTSPYLGWYVNYCCADDYGASLENVSAWAGVHYFASRKGKAGNAKSDDVLTWPEGNHWLVKQLQHQVSGRIRTGCIALSVAPHERHVAVDYWDQSSGVLRRLEADRVILATKFHYPMGPDPNQRGNSRRHIIQACEASLRRLQTDYIDLYQSHRPDFDIPLDETLRALDDLATQGKVRYIGSSTAPAWHVMEAIMVSELKGYVRFVSEQPPYNLLDRRIENELAPMCQRHGLALITWSPMAMGLLAGRYASATQPPGDSRAILRGGIYAERVTPASVEVGNRFVALAREHGYDPAQLAVLWVKDQPGVTAPIIGPRTVEQLHALLPVMEMTLPDAVRAACDELVKPGSAVVSFFNTAPWMKLKFI